MTPEQLAAKGLRVKPLIFEQANFGLWSSGMALGGEYRIKLTGGQGFQVSRGMLAVPDNLTWFPDFQSATAAAQADCATRIAAMIEEVT